MKKHPDQSKSLAKKMANWFRRGKTAIWWALACFVLISEGAASAIRDWFKALQQHGVPGVMELPVDSGSVLYVVAFVAVLLWFRVAWREYQPVRILAQRHGASPQEVVILTISRPEFVRLRFKDEETIEARAQHRNGEFEFTGDLAVDVASKPGRGNWQQILRALKPHHESGKLRRIYLIGSRDKGDNYGSFAYLDRCEKFLRRYFPEVEIDLNAAKIVGPSGIDFERLDEMRTAIECCIDDAKGAGYEENQIVVDVTGGQKTTSIAACLETLTRDIEFQYVQTDGAVIEIVRYNVVSEVPPRPG